ncbi:CA14 [Symbiodinium microadriaticum]|nr:CA14 [Symbiodinium microadriaticum]
MSMEQWATFKAMFPSPGNNRPVQPIRSHNIAKNSFQDGGEPKQFDFFLGRHEARDRFFPGEFFILVPIVATLLLMTVIMLSIFKRDVIGGKSNMSTLAETIGNSMGYSQV